MMLRKHTLLVTLLTSLAFLCGSSAWAEENKLIIEPGKPVELTQSGDTTAKFYAQLFMGKMQHAAQSMPSLNDTEKLCIQGLPADTMLPAFQRRFTAQELARIDAVHTPAFQSAYKKLTSGMSSNQMASLNITEDEKQALKQAENSSTAKVTDIIHSSVLKRKSLAMFEKAAEKHCHIK